MLAHALLEVSNLKPKDSEEAMRVMDAIPAAIINRVFRIWRGSFPPSQRFTVSKLYKAPAPAAYVKRIEEDEDRENVAHDKTVREMENKFGMQDVEDAREIDNRILAAARRREGGFKGAVPATEDKL